MKFPITEHVARSRRHTSFYLACGMAQATPIIFLHGWPELSISWRHQLPVFAGLGFRAVAPDMRGYGRSSVYGRHEDYALEEVVADMIELADALGAERAIWVGHDWGSPVIWSIAQHHPGRCHGVASLCVPYIPAGFRVEPPFLFAIEAFIRRIGFPRRNGITSCSIGRALRPRAPPSKQMFAPQCARFSAGVTQPVKANRRAPHRFAQTAVGSAPNARPRSCHAMPPCWARRTSTATSPRSSAMASSVCQLVFNADANAAYAQRAQPNWHLRMPVLFLHGASTMSARRCSRALPNPCGRTRRSLKKGSSRRGIGWTRSSRLRSMPRWRNGWPPSSPGYGLARARARHTAPRDLYPGGK